MLATNAGLTVVTFLSLRMRPEALSPVKWRLAEWPRRIFPPAVNLKRLRAPRCVFNFIFGFDAFLGIAKTFPCLLNSLSAEERFLSQQKQMAWRNARVTAPAARPKQLVRRTWKSSRLSSAPEAPRERCLPCAAWSRSALDRQFPAAAGPSWHAPLPDGPSRGHVEKSWRALCGRHRGSG